MLQKISFDNSEKGIIIRDQVKNMSTLPTFGVMLVTNQINNIPTGGRELLSGINHDILKNLYGERLTVLKLKKESIQGLSKVLNSFRGFIDGITRVGLDSISEAIFSKKVKKLFVDGSNFGEIVRYVKTQHPNVQVYTFFHNAEVRFFLGLFRQNKTLHALAVVVVNYLAERKSVMHSDKIICLNQRDSQMLYKFYGRAATYVSPIAMQDKLLLPCNQSHAPSKKEKFAIFVGGGFYANRAGIIWFAKNVAPRINIRTCIVGRGLEDLRDELQVDPNVELVGAVDSLGQWYRDSHFVIAPIFDGSGMKTKVAEALMFGKKIIGTPEAFTGYEDVANRIGYVCSTADEFITAINCAEALEASTFDRESRDIYEKKYSFDAARKRFIDFMGV